MPADIKATIEARAAVVSVVGLGYVGLPLMLAAVDGGFRVLGFDIDPMRVGTLNDGRSPFKHIDNARVEAARRSGRFEATSDLARAKSADALLICVPTPLGPHQEPDLSFVEGTGRALAPHLRAGQLVVLESTTWPGTTREILKPILESTGLVSEKTLFIAYSPEREDPGNGNFHTAAIPKVIGGDGPISLALALSLYGAIATRTVPVSSTDVAEAVKLTENIFRAVNIALVNELKCVFTAMGLDIFEVIGAASTKPFGYMPFWPGPGLGGHCIPIDPFYLTWRAREYGIASRFIELAGEINTAMPRWVVERLALALDAHAKKGLNGRRILVVGIAYKKNVDDCRESPALTIMGLLEERGAECAYHDPHVPEIPGTRKHGRFVGRQSVPLDEATLAGFDAAVVVTDHDCISWPMLVEHSQLIVDTRNVTKAVTRHRDRIVLA